MAPGAAVTTAAATLAARVAAAGLDWIVPEWPAPPQVLGLTTTRACGPGAIETLAPGDETRPPTPGDASGTPMPGDAAAADAHGRHQLDAFLPSPPVWLAQVHGTRVAVVDATTIATARAVPPIADAAVTRERGVVCAVRTADCLPVVFANRAGTAVGIAHAGWRGLAAGVLEATVAALASLGAEPGELIAWFGPAIGPAAFEVGDDVRAAFAAADPASTRCFAPLGEGKWRADLYALAQRRLAAAGVHAVHGGGWCTVTEAARFYSYRRARDTARMATLVWLAPDAAQARL